MTHVIQFKYFKLYENYNKMIITIIYAKHAKQLNFQIIIKLHKIGMFLFIYLDKKHVYSTEVYNYCQIT